MLNAIYQLLVKGWDKLSAVYALLVSVVAVVRSNGDHLTRLQLQVTAFTNNQQIMMDMLVNLQQSNSILKSQLVDAIALLSKIAEDLKPPAGTPRIVFQELDEAGNIIREGDSPMDVTIPLQTVRRYRAVVLDEFGNKTRLDQVDTPSQIVSANPEIAEVIDFNVDAMTFGVQTKTKATEPGTQVSINLNGDADLAPGQTTPITGALNVTVPAGNAVRLDFEEFVPTEGNEPASRARRAK